MKLCWLQYLSGLDKLQLGGQPTLDPTFPLSLASPPILFQFFPCHHRWLVWPVFSTVLPCHWMACLTRVLLPTFLVQPFCPLAHHFPVIPTCSAIRPSGTVLPVPMPYYAHLPYCEASQHDSITMCHSLKSSAPVIDEAEPSPLLLGNLPSARLFVNKRVKMCQWTRYRLVTTIVFRACAALGHFSLGWKIHWARIHQVGHG